MVMKKILAWTALLPLLLLTACSTPDDFAIGGTVIDYEYCTSTSDLGFAVQLQSPDTLGATYYTGANQRYENVIVVYGNNKRLRDGDRISARVYLDPGYSDAYCNYHYRDTRGEVPEAVFTELTILE